VLTAIRGRIVPLARSALSPDGGIREGRILVVPGRVVERQEGHVRSIVSFAALGAATLVAAVAANGGTDAGSATPQRVAVGMTEFRFTVTPKTVRKNAVITFALTNRGAIGHDFRVGGKKSAVRGR
jgi:hypothetical protein